MGSRPIGRTHGFGPCNPGSSPGSPADENAICHRGGGNVGLAPYDLRFARDRRPDRPDHGRGRGDADALLAAEDASSRLRAGDDRLACGGRSRGRRGACRRDRLSQSRSRRPHARGHGDDRPARSRRHGRRRARRHRRRRGTRRRSSSFPAITRSSPPRSSRGFSSAHAAGAAATVAHDDHGGPRQLGRIVRDANGDVDRIAEAKYRARVTRPRPACDQGGQQLDLRLRRRPAAAAALENLTNDNAQGEYYLGDVLPLMPSAGGRVTAHIEATTRA